MLPSLMWGFPVQHQTLFFVEWEAEELQLLVWLLQEQTYKNTTIMWGKNFN